MVDKAASKRALRAEMRARRRSLSAAEQRRNARLLAGHVARLPQFRAARRVALYWAADGEIDVAPVMRLCWQRRKRVYLPRLAGREMHFAELKRGKRTIHNRYGIPEPDLSAAAEKADALDLILAPLVAFTPAGDRLGMGGGFYDRALGSARGWVVGVAHSCQCVEALPQESWDLRMAGVITEKGPVGPLFRGSGGSAIFTLMKSRQP